MSGLPSSSGAATGLDHIGIAGRDLDALAAAFAGLGFTLTPRAAHASGRTANRCVMLRDGGYLELMATVPGQASATLDRFLASGPGAHILALEIADETQAEGRLKRAGIEAEAARTERDADGTTARFSLLMPPDTPEGRILLIRHLTPGALWRPEVTSHPNGALALTEAVFAVASPATAAAWLSRVSGRPAEPDPAGGFRIPLARGRIRILPPSAAAALFPGLTAGPPLIGLTLTASIPEPRLITAGGVTIRMIPAGDGDRA